MLRLIPLLFVLATLGCQNSAPSESSAAAPTPEANQTAPAGPAKVDGPKAKELVAAGAVLLDVRTQAEWDGGHVEGAKLIPVQELAGRMSEVGPKDQPVVVYCASGKRSASAADQLSKAGWSQVNDLGAMANW